MSTDYSRKPIPWPSGRMRDALITGLQRLGFVVGAMHVLALPSRRSGIPRSTPVSVLTIAGERYLVAGLDDLEWVLDARAMGRGVLQRGRVDELVALSELPIGERAGILGQMPGAAPAAVAYLSRLYRIPAEAEAFAALAPRCPVFRIERR